MDNYENNNNNEEYSNNTSNTSTEENENIPQNYDQAAERRNKIIGFLIIVAIIVAIKMLSGD